MNKICFASFKKLMIRKCTPPCAGGWRRRLGTPWRLRQGEHNRGDVGDGVGGGGGGEQGGGVQVLDSSWFLMLLSMAGSCTEVQ